MSIRSFFDVGFKKVKKSFLKKISKSLIEYLLHQLSGAEFAETDTYALK